jgi:predicted RNase H-like HicB family nuclease
VNVKSEFTEEDFDPELHAELDEFLKLPRVKQLLRLEGYRHALDDRNKMVPELMAELADWKGGARSEAGAADEARAEVARLRAAMRAALTPELLARVERLAADPSAYAYDVAWSDEDEVFVCYVTDFPGIAAHGDTERDALREARLAVAGAIDSLIEEGVEPPPPKARR